MLLLTERLVVQLLFDAGSSITTESTPFSVSGYPASLQLLSGLDLEVYRHWISAQYAPSSIQVRPYRVGSYLSGTSTWYGATRA